MMQVITDDGTYYGKDAVEKLKQYRIILEENIRYAEEKAVSMEVRYIMVARYHRFKKDMKQYYAEFYDEIIGEDK